VNIMLRTPNYEVREDQVASSKSRGLENVFETCKSFDDAVDRQLGSSWLDTCEPEPTIKSHRWIVRDRKLPHWDGTEFTDKEKAYKMLERCRRSCYIFHHVPEQKDLDEDRAERNERKRYEWTGPHRPLTAKAPVNHAHASEHAALKAQVERKKTIIRRDYDLAVKKSD